MKYTCDGTTQGGYWSKRCGKGASMEHEGKHYCKTHHPPTMDAKREARHEAWRAKYNAGQEEYRRARLAKAQDAHKLAVYPFLVEALQYARSQGSDSWDQSILEKVDEALAKVDGLGGA